MSIVGIDVASKSANFAVLGSRGFISTNNEFTMDSRGFEAFLTSRDVAEDDVFVMESTGNYHLPLYNWLLNHGRKALIINPVLIKQHQKGITIRKTKTDRLDAMAIARYAADPSVRLPQGERSMDTESKIFARRREQNAEELTKALLDIEASLHKEAVEIVASMPGIGLVTASQFMAEVEDISRFETYQKLIAFMGTDPGIYQSGESERHGHITKRGNASLRKYVYLMAQGSINWNPVFNAYYHKKRDSGFPHRKAMVATMNKLIRTLFILLTRGEKYCEGKV